jgi:hypothetical protein
MREPQTKKNSRYKWFRFRGTKGRLPPQRRYVLVQVTPEDHGRPIVTVGWLKYAAGDKRCPYFVVPAIGGEPKYWSDCLGDDFFAPQWLGQQVSK